MPSTGRTNDSLTPPTAPKASRRLRLHGLLRTAIFLFSCIERITGSLARPFRCVYPMEGHLLRNFRPVYICAYTTLASTRMTRYHLPSRYLQRSDHLFQRNHYSTWRNIVSVEISCSKNACNNSNRQNSLVTECKAARTFTVP